MRFEKELKEVPSSPGCYLMYNSDGVVIYVGKAKILTNRLHSYFNRTHTGKTAKMVSEIDHFEYIVTHSESEAFILELNLIKKFDPKYNILLRDDKSYPYIELTNEKYPRLIVKRQINIQKKKTNLYGPYPNAYAAKRLVNLINRIYPLKKCENMPKKVCLYYHIGECLGYCENKNVDFTKYKNEIISILNGNNKILLEKIDKQIEINSDNLNFEVCKELMEDLTYIKEIQAAQSIVELPYDYNGDIINYYFENGYLSIVIFFVRNGKLVGNHYKIVPVITEIEETIEYYIVSFYSKSNIAPKELIIPSNLDNELLSSVIGVSVINTSRGAKKHLFDMAYENAKREYEKEINLIYRNEELTHIANDELKSLLKLENLHIIEAFDNSNLFGTFNVSGMVSFVDGSPNKNGYRKFKLSLDKNDDVRSMKEVIYRRYFKLLSEDKPLPDLIIVDGGQNQINACKESLNDLELNIKVIGVKKDNHHSPEAIVDGNTFEELKIDKKSNVFMLLSRIDEEVHRFTISYHKEIRSKGSISSVLDNISGLGAVRKKALIKKYGSVTKMKNASLEDLSKIIPEKTAKDLLKYLNSLE